MTINEAYVFCQTIANKSQQGSLSPEQFNNLAPIAQLSVISQILGNEQEYQPGRPVPRYGLGISQKIDENLRPLVVVIASAGPSLIYPSNSLYIWNISESNGKTIYPTQIDEFDILQQSVIKPPIVGRGIYCISGELILIMPTTITNINVTYIKRPTPPVWGYTFVNTVPTFDAGSSVDFQIGDMLHLRICAKILQSVGINLSLEQVTAYAAAVEASGA